MPASTRVVPAVEEQDPVMGFFIADAHSQIGGGQGDPTFSFIMLIALFAVFYFVLIRPQSKRQKEHKAMVASLSKGDEVVTNGGLLGKITNVGDSFVTNQDRGRIAGPNPAPVHCGPDAEGNDQVGLSSNAFQAFQSPPFPDPPE